MSSITLGAEVFKVLVNPSHNAGFIDELII